jgi:hypothetical protein
LLFLNHTQRRSTVGRTPLDELITHPEESYRLCCVVVCDLETSRVGAPYMYDISSLRVKRFEFESFGDNNAIKMSLSALLLTVVV